MLKSTTKTTGRPITTPAFWDLHLHGVAGIDFMHADKDAALHACQNLGAHGIGYFAPTLLTSEMSLLKEACRRWGRILEKCAQKNFLPKTAALPLGLHLEGPFLNPKMAGAHPPKALRTPNPRLAQELIELAQGYVAIVTLAPELPGTLTLIRGLVRQGIRVQLGHTLATAEQAMAAVKAGATGLTHVYNAMRIHHRDPGVLTPLLKGRVTGEIITDGLHLAPEFVCWCVHGGRSQLYGVSDGCSAIGAHSGKVLTLGSLRLRRQGDGALVAATGTLAGGATYLTSHPSRLAQALGFKPAQSMLPLFYQHQRRLFPRHARQPRARCVFHPKTLRFLGTQ